MANNTTNRLQRAQCCETKQQENRKYEYWSFCSPTRRRTVPTLVAVVRSAEVDAYVERSEKWPEEIAALRPVLLSCGLVEGIKWRSWQIPRGCSSSKDRTRDQLAGYGSTLSRTWPG